MSTEYVRRDEFEALRARVEARVHPDTIFFLILVDMGKVYTYAKQLGAWACDRVGLAKFLPAFSHKKKRNENGGGGSSSSLEYRYSTTPIRQS